MYRVDIGYDEPQPILISFENKIKKFLLLEWILL